ncbi:BTB domain-containing protein [Favolaschia claudopus]|uniref:BTB domain-containing protein n=1 Tax=Favolaschia claudopus TaxID=2862362 RepID=A0AAW0CBB5_9AGAR
MATPSETTLVHSEALWFSSDVVVLRAESRLFRIFVAILKEKSSVFADMFAFPQPSQASGDVETVDGVPVVTVYDDPVQLEIFLKAIFDSEFLLSLSIQTHLSEFLSILRLSHKYDVPFLRRLTLSQLESLFPTTLTQYDARAPPIFGVNKAPSPSSLPTLFSVVQTLTEVDAPWLLPVLYYDICRLDLDKIISSSAWLTLSDAQRRPFLMGSQNQARQMFNVIEFSFLAKGQYDPQCKDWKTCNKNRLQLAHAMSRRTLPLVLTSPLDVWSPVFWEAVETAQDPLCKPCVTEARNLHALARQTFWNGLPGLYDLADWHELEELRNAAFPLS